MKTIQFTAYPDGYRCSEPGEQSGEYVKAEVAKELIGALEIALINLRNAARLGIGNSGAIVRAETAIWNADGRKA